MWLLGEIHIYQSLQDSTLSGKAVLGTLTEGVWAQWNRLTFQGKLRHYTGKAVAAAEKCLKPNGFW